MEYNKEFKILFEKSILSQLFYAYKFDFPLHELIDDIYANCRTFDPDCDRVNFVYKQSSDYSKLIKYLKKKGVK